MPWYATQQIRQGTALAYDVGHPVPASNVERHGYDTDGLVTWVEPGDETPTATAASVLMGVFPNAPQRPEPPIEEGVREPATDGSAAPPAPKLATKSKPSDGANTDSSEG